MDKEKSEIHHCKCWPSVGSTGRSLMSAEAQSSLRCSLGESGLWLLRGRVSADISEECTREPLKSRQLLMPKAGSKCTPST